MQILLKEAIFTFGFIFAALCVLLEATDFEEHKKSQMIEDLEIIKHHFEIGYAPSVWKKEYAGWNLNAAFEQSKARILSLPSITTKQFQQILVDFLRTMNDYHVDVMFHSTEEAYLPFSVRGVEGRYFIDWVDPVRLSASYYDIRQGDELIEFDGHPIAEIIADLAKVSGKSANPNTDRALTEMKLTNRFGMDGDIVPKGPVDITTISVKNGKIKKHQLCWSYTPEHVKNSLDFIQTLDFISSFFNKFNPQTPKLEFTKIIMANPLHQALSEKQLDRNGGFGCRKSFLPDCGEIIWSNSNSQDDDSLPFWHAYIYQHNQGYKIGYIRIPHYYFKEDFEDEIEEFGNIIQMMQKKTNALVIDQLHNYGGYVHIQYALASILTNRPLQAPYHCIKISQEDALDAYQNLEKIKRIELAAEQEERQGNHSNFAKNGKEVQIEEKEVDGFYFEGERVNFQEVMLYKNYFEHILTEWNEGRTLTRPTPIAGVDKINPHPKYQYTKPILMLIDEMDFSGGDIIPAIFQDNKRAVLFGARTAGAGGYVSKFKFPNNHGIAQCSYTASIAERTDLTKIENLGVSPDIPYQITVEDVQFGYRTYIEAVNQAVGSLLQNSVIK